MNLSITRIDLEGAREACAQWLVWHDSNALEAANSSGFATGVTRRRLSDDEFVHTELYIDKYISFTCIPSRQIFKSFLVSGVREPRLAPQLERHWN